MAYEGSSELRLDEFIYSRNDKVGKGSFGIVYKGRDKNTNTIVAIKEIKKEPEDEEFLKREKQILSELSEARHENLVVLIKSVENDEYLYLIMEYCNHGDLDEYLHYRKRLNTETLQHFFKQIAQALHVMNRMDIIHRDLKPQNILLHKPYDRVDPHPLEINIKIADFGVARFLNSNDLATTLCGSPRYMAPEVLLEEPYSIKADLWSVGIMLYECAVGAVSFIRPSWSLNTLKNFYVEDGDLNLQVPLGTSKRLQILLTNLLVINQRKRMDVDTFLDHSFFEADLSTVVIPSDTPKSTRSPNTTFENLDINFDLDNSLLPRLLRVNRPSAPAPEEEWDEDWNDEKTIVSKNQVQRVEENVLFHVIALYTFTARTPNELSFEKNEPLQILSISSTNPDFYTAKNSDSKIGYIPKNYVKPISEVEVSETEQRRFGALIDTQSWNSIQVTVIEKPKKEEKIGEMVKLREEKKENAKIYENFIDFAAHIKLRPYFYEKMTRNECEIELNKRGSTGDFLLRESETRPGVYSLSVKFEPRNLHFTISKCSDQPGKILIGQTRFSSMEELIKFYSKTMIYHISNTSHMLFLRNPLLKIPEVPRHNIVPQEYYASIVK